MKTNELLNKIKQIAHKLCIVQNLTIAINYAHIKCNIYSAFNWNAIQSHFFHRNWFAVIGDLLLAFLIITIFSHKIK